MNKFSKFFAAFASLALFACSSDEPLVNGGEQNPEEGPTAYLKVAIRDANSGSRANDDADDATDYINGTAMEGMVSDAYFFFFDDKGVYVGQSSIWNGPDGPNQTNPNEPPTSDDKVELKGSSVIVVDKTETKGYPKYMVTVLNIGAIAHTEFSQEKLKGMTIEDFSKLPFNWNSTATRPSAAGGAFIMSTTSFFGTGETGTYYTNNHEDGTLAAPRYYATVLHEDNFVEDRTDAIGAEAVEVYVERLASRVNLSTKDQKNPFAVDVTIAGLENGELVDPGQTGAEKVYVKILGWGLNGLQEKSYLSKQLKSTGFNWDNTTKFGTDWNWNKPVFFRSFWAQSMNYANIKYDENVPENSTLKYVTYGELEEYYVNETTLYCNENTTTRKNLGDDNAELPDNRLLTTVLVKARVYKDKGCTQALNLVEHNGLWFEADAFKAYILGIVKKNNNSEFFRIVNDGTEDKYVGLNETDVKFAGTNAKVYLEYTGNKNDQLWVLNPDYKASEEGSKKYLSRKGSDFQAALDVADQRNSTNVNTFMANGGDVKYEIPIEHLNDITRADDENNVKGVFYEGSYGVVRNHAYNVTINSIKRLGKGIYDPSEDVIPDKTNETPEWYLGATINVLSWRIVNQSVDL